MTTPDFINHGKMWFDVPPMKHQPRLFVVHYTAGEGPAAQVYRTLTQRKLSVHFCIDADGEVFQFADLHSHCSHASSVNDFAVGVEMVNAGMPGAAVINRLQYDDEARGKTHKFLDFYDSQKTALFQLADYVTNELAIPRALPLESVSGALQVLRSEIPHTQLFAGPGSKLFKGVCGHSHVPSKSGKVDPGPRILDELAAYWGLL